MNLISKKDLLSVTGISYGQLYRWKRQQLIPEEWFIKKSSYTGQETFFPREQMLSRIETILQLKDQYSMEQLAELFSKGNGKTAGLSREELLQIEELPEDWREKLPELMNQSVIGLDDVVAAVYLAGLTGLPEENKRMLLGSLPKPIPAGGDGAIGVLRTDETYHLLILKGTAALAFDEGVQVENLQAWSSIADALRLKYKKIFRGGV